MTKKSLTCVLVLLASTVAFGAVVNVDFGSTGGSGLDPNATYIYSGQGVLEDPNNDLWNGIKQNALPAANLLASDGSATGVSLAITGAKRGWNNPGAAYIANPKDLMSDYLYVRDESNSILVNGLLPDAAYTLVIYGAGDNAGQGGLFTVGDVNVAFPGPDASTPDILEGEDYAILDVVSDANGVMEIMWENIPDNGRFAGFNGLQIVGDFLPAPVHHWTLDDDTSDINDVNIVDVVGGMTGINMGAVSDANGVKGAAMRFDGTNYVEIADFNTADLKNITVSLWINPDPNLSDTGDIKRVFSAADHWEVVMQGSTGQMANNFYQKGGTYPKSVEIPVEGEWTHVAMTSSLMPDGDGLMTIYLNGVFDTEMAETADDDFAGGTVMIGARPGRPDKERFKGAIDEIRIYNSVLSAEEISVLPGQ